MVNDYFVADAADHTQLASFVRQVCGLPMPLADRALRSATSPLNATWYNSVDTDRPVRLGVTKLYEPSLFANKLDGVPTKTTRFSHKLLFDWSQN